jgi:hypothetical protein
LLILTLWLRDGEEGMFLPWKGFSQPSLFFVKEMTTLDTFLAHAYSMAKGWRRSDVSSRERVSLNLHSLLLKK